MHIRRTPNRELLADVCGLRLKGKPSILRSLIIHYSTSVVVFTCVGFPVALGGGAEGLGPFPGSGWVTPVGILHFSVVGRHSVISHLRLLSPGRGLRLYFLNWGISVLISLLPFPIFLRNEDSINQSINFNLNSHKHFYSVEKKKLNTFKYIRSRNI